ncbi:MAG: 30S ribosomal protein S15 [Candidatus Neomarinimicrobiota bacterium]
MSLTEEQKQEVIKKYALKESDTGSPEVQIALLTAQIRQLTEHFKVHKKDHHSRRGLINMVAKRRKLLTYIHRTKPDAYTSLISQLGLRR